MLSESSLESMWNVATLLTPMRNRWWTHCASCNLRSTTSVDVSDPCCRYNGPLAMELEEAVLDREIRSMRMHRTFVDVTAHRSVPGDMLPGRLHPSLWKPMVDVGLMP